MKNMNFDEIVNRSVNIRKEYRKLEEKYHGKEWSIEEDALAFLTDAALVGRLTMDNQGRWPDKQEFDLEHKIGESIWWLIVLADRMDMDAGQAIDKFLNKTEKNFKNS